MEAGDRNAPGIAEAMRYASLKVTKRAMLGRGVSVLRKKDPDCKPAGQSKGSGGESGLYLR